MMCHIAMLFIAVVSQVSHSYPETLVMPHWNMYIRYVKKWKTCQSAKPSLP